MSENTIREILDRYTADRNFSGVCYVRQRADVVVYEARGLAHRGFGVPNTIETRFDIASVTKMFTAAAVMQLVDQGKLSLDTKLMPALGIGDTPISDEVTIRHCLTHTSGIADDADEENDEDYELLFVDKPNYSIRETRDFVPQCTGKEAKFPPGEGVRYNNCAFVLTGLVIESLTGMPYRDYVRQHIFEPAGMIGADFCAMDGVCPNFAEHYKDIEHEDGSIEWRKNIYSYPPVGSPDGGATVSGADLDTFYQAVRSGALMSEESSALLLSPQAQRLDDNWPNWYGFGFEMNVDAAGQVTKIGKEGMNAGVCSMAAWYPPQDAAVIVLANQMSNVWEMVGEIEAVLGVG